MLNLRLDVDLQIKNDIVEVARAMPTDGCSGNVSARAPGGFFITPSALEYNIMEPDDIVFMGRTGPECLRGRKPSSEWPFHKAIYDTYDPKDVGAIVHCHSPAVKVIAAVDGLTEISAVHYEIAESGRTAVPITQEFDLPGADLVQQVLAGLNGGNAVVLANHGQIALGKNLAKALSRARSVEAASATFIDATNLAASLRLLRNKVFSTRIIDDAKMRRMIVAYDTYGQNK